MIKVYIRQKWNGMVAIRDKYVKEAREKNEPLELRCEWEIMTIPVSDIDKHTRFIKGPYEDKFSKEKHMLVYIWWVKDKVGNDPVKKKFAYRAKKQQKKAKLYAEANELYAKDPEAWHKKYCI